MPRAGLYRRSRIKTVRPAVRLEGGATAQHFGGAVAAQQRVSGDRLQQTSSSLLQDEIRQKRIDKAEQEKAEHEAEIARNKAEARAEQAANIAAEATGRAASNAFQKDLRELERELYQKQGKDAADIYDVGSAAIEALHTKHRQGLGGKELKSFEYYSDGRYNSSLDSLSKYDLTAKKNYELQTLQDSVVGNTNDVIGFRYDPVKAEEALQLLANDAHDIGVNQGLSPEQSRTLLQNTLQGAHLQVINTMMTDGKFDEAFAWLDKYQQEFTPSVQSTTYNEIYQKSVRAQAPQLVKEILTTHPGDIPAQAAALDQIDDEQLRELTRRELVVQRAVQAEKVQRQEQELFENVLTVALKNEDGSIPVMWQRQPIPSHIIDKVATARDELVGNSVGSRDYYYDVKDLLATKSTAAATFEISPQRLTREQYQQLRDIQSSLRGELSRGGSAETAATSWMQPSQQIKNTITAAMGDEVEPKLESRIVDRCIARFEAEGAATYKERKAIIDEVLLEYVQGEEKEGFRNENMSAGEAAQRGYSEVFQPDRPDSIPAEAEYDFGAKMFVYPNKSEHGVTLYDGYGRDVTPLNLEPGSKWNKQIKHFIKIDETAQTRRISDKSGELIFEMPLEAKYNEFYQAYTYPDKIEIDGVVRPGVRIYNLKDGSTTIKF